MYLASPAHLLRLIQITLLPSPSKCTGAGHFHLHPCGRQKPSTRSLIVHTQARLRSLSARGRQAHSLRVPRAGPRKPVVAALGKRAAC